MDENKHFSMIFWFIVGLCGFGALFTMACVFIPIPKTNERFADQALVFWLSTAVGGGIGYMIGSSMKRPGAKPGTTEISASITAEASTNNQNPIV